ncbi:MAG: hypothetical protein LUO93_11920 [Methanomicrobiales archaeon]|nr:hypothetical protein [Methanomicrobiales archaeon]
MNPIVAMRLIRIATMTVTMTAMVLRMRAPVADNMMLGSPVKIARKVRKEKIAVRDENRDEVDNAHHEQF